MRVMCSPDGVMRGEAARGTLVGQSQLAETWDLSTWDLSAWDLSAWD